MANMTVPMTCLTPPTVAPNMVPVPMAFQPTMLVPVAMVVVNVPTPCSTPTSVPSYPSSEFASEGAGAVSFIPENVYYLWNWGLFIQSL